MNDPQDFQWPLPVGLTDAEVLDVRLGLVASAEAYRAGTVDKATDYMATLAAACVGWVEDDLDRRGVAFGG